MRILSPIRHPKAVPGSRLSSPLAQVRGAAARFAHLLLLSMLLGSPAAGASSASIQAGPAHTEPLGAAVALPQIVPGIVPGIFPSGEFAIGSSPMIDAKNSEPDPARAVASRPGAYCPIGGCPSPGSSRLSDTAAYGAAIIGGAWFARRRVRPDH